MGPLPSPQAISQSVGQRFESARRFQISLAGHRLTAYAMQSPVTGRRADDFP